MNKTLGLLLLLIVVLGVGYVAYRLGVLPLLPTDNNQPVAVLSLENLPNGYCPKTSEVVIAANNKILLDRQVAITGCRQIDLQTILTSTDITRLVLVNLPKARSFSIEWPPAKNTDFSYAPALGDVNGDNSINSTDVQLIKTALFTQNSSLDLDGDGTISAMDLTVAGLNQGVGIAKPDNQPWRTL